MKFDHLFFHGTSPMRARVAPAGGRRRAWSEDPLMEAGGSEFFEMLLSEADLPPNAYRPQALARRLPACLRLLKASDPREAVRKLAAQPALAKEAIDAVLLGVTDFFRDQAVFERIERDVLPALLSRYAKLRIWSAACSDGQELYSVAMLLARTSRLGDCELMGTDCRPDAIAQARGGVFAHDQVARLDPEWRRLYFNRSGAAGAIDATVRGATFWKVANLLGEVERGPWHLILWRNMAIYLETERANEIWAKLLEQLSPGGFLIVGKADHPPPWLTLARVGPCIYRKRGS